MTHEPTADYEQFAQEWTPLIYGKAYQLGFNASTIDDGVQQVLVDLWAGDYLAKYDPSRAKFSTYVYTQIELRLRDIQRTLMRRWEREATLVLDDDEERPREFSTAPKHDVVEMNACLSVVLAELSALPSTETQNFARLMQYAIEQIAADGELDQRALAARFGISPQAISRQIKRLRGLPQLAALRSACYA